MSEPQLILNWRDWPALSVDELHALLQLRSAVFVVEQDCVFQDMDGLDPRCRHLCACDGETLIGTLRLIPPAAERLPTIGRVAVAQSHRGRGLGRLLMNAAISECERLWPNQAIQLAAQERLQRFYQSLDFARCSERYLEDGIWHIDMRRLARSEPAA